MHDDMPTAPLGEIATITMGQSPDSAHVNSDDRGLPFLQGSAEFGARFPSPKVYCSPPLRVAQAGSTLISVRAPVGATNRADRDYCIGRGLGAVLAKPGVADDVFVQRAIEQNLTYLHRRSQGSTFLAIGSADLAVMPVAAPRLPEQQRISEILSTVDEAIEHTEGLVAKTQHIKAGLMHNLFTRGVTADCRLRPRQEEAPHLYRESALGWIPKEWGDHLLDDIAVRGSGHTPNRNHPEYWNGEIKWISLADSWRLDRLHIPDTDHKITQAGIDNSSAVLHPPGVVVLSRDAGVGKSAITTCEMAVSQHFMCWRCGPALNNYYLYYWLQYRKWEFENIATGSTIPTIGLGFFRRYRICAPTAIREQESIAATLVAVDEKLFGLEEDLQKQQLLRSGLMHDLLTGRIRVTAEVSHGLGKAAASV